MKKIKFSFSLIVLLFISSCSFATPPEKIEFPKTDIIYQAISSNFSNTPSDNLIGFVNADGSGNTTIKISYRAHLPVFSKAWNGIFFIRASSPFEIGKQGGILLFLNSKGEYKDCNTTDPAYSSFVFPMNVNGMKFVLATDTSSIQLLSLDDCKVTKTFLKQSEPVQAVIGSVFPSSTGDQVIFDFYDFSRQTREIKIMDMNTGETRDILAEGYTKETRNIATGYNPSLSPDDTKIAFVEDDGIYIADSNGANRHLLVSLSFPKYFDSLLPTPFWSPDGTLLIYHKCINQVCHDLSDFSIYKVDVTSGKETKIVDKGLFPVWIK